MLPIARAGEYLQMRKMLADELGGFHRGLDVVDGEHEDLGVVRIRRAQQFETGGVSVVHLIPEAAQEIALGLAGLERREGDLLGAKNAADDLSEAAEAGDDDFGV